MAALHGPHAAEIAQRVVALIGIGSLENELAKIHGRLAMISMYLVAQEKAGSGAGSRTVDETMQIVTMKQALLRMVTGQLHTECGPIEALLDEAALEKLRAAGILPRKENS